MCTNQKPTWVDFYFFEFINLLRWLTDGQILKEYPALKIYYDEMCQLPKLKEHLENANAAERQMQFNGKSALLNGTQSW